MIIGVLGAGRAGARHIQNAKELGHEVLVHDPQNNCTAGNNYERDEVLGNANVIISASPTHQHLRDLTDAITAGTPILIEKPIANIGQSAEMDRLLTLARDLPIATGFNLRFHPHTDFLRNFDTYYVSLICAQHTDTPADGVLNHWASHEIDLARYVLGNVRLLDTHVIDNSYADLYLVNWETNARAHIHSDMIARDFYRRAFAIDKSGWATVDYELYPVSNEDYQDELETFIQWVETGKQPKRIATGWDGLEVLKICEQASALNAQRDQ